MTFWHVRGQSYPAARTKSNKEGYAPERHGIIGVSGGVVDIAPGTAVRLTTTATDDEAGRLKGFIMNGDRPVRGALAVLAPKHGSNDPDEYRGFQTDSDGSFDYQNVPAGDYILFAVGRLDL